MARDAELESLAERLGSGLQAWSLVGWGDARATRRLVLSDDRVLAARRFAGRTAVEDARRIATIMGRIADAGIPVPRASVVDGPGIVAWLTTPWIEGESGAAWLESGDRARHLATRMGELAVRLATVDPSDLDLDRRAVVDRDIASLARRQLEGVAVDEVTRRVVGRQLDHLASQPDRAPVFAHGDFAPVNMVIGRDGAVSALLDLEHARVAPPGADAAWWSWVVRHHHPDAWAASWRTFLDAAAIDANLEEDRLGALALCQLLDRAATASGAAPRDRWLGLLAQAADRIPNRQAM